MNNIITKETANPKEKKRKKSKWEALRAARHTFDASTKRRINDRTSMTELIVLQQ